MCRNFQMIFLQHLFFTFLTSLPRGVPLPFLLPSLLYSSLSYDSMVLPPNSYSTCFSFLFLYLRYCVIENLFFFIVLALTRGVQWKQHAIHATVTGDLLSLFIMSRCTVVQIEFPPSFHMLQKTNFEQREEIVMGSQSFCFVLNVIRKRRHSLVCTFLLLTH